MKLMRFLGPMALVCTGVTVAAPVGQAYVCAQAQDETGDERGPALTWFSRQLDFTLSPLGTSRISNDDELNVLRQSFVVWERLIAAEDDTCADAVASTDLTFTEKIATTPFMEAGFNQNNSALNNNLLIFYDTAWPHGDLGQNVLAITTTTYNANTGEIYDADIEFNSSAYDFGITGAGHQIDLMNTAVHEIGHFVGLSHSAVVESTMYAGAQLGETKKRTLECDDVQAIALKYPADAPNRYCTSAVPGCSPTCAAPSTQEQNNNADSNDSSRSSSRGGCNITGVATSAWLFGLSLVALIWRGYRCRNPLKKRRASL